MAISEQTRTIPAGTWNVDPVHSSATFAVKHLGVSTFRSAFKAFDVKLVDGQLTGTVDVESIDIDQEDFRGHLFSPDFFDVERYKQIQFASDELTVDGAGNVTLAGELTIRGATKPVKATGTLEGPFADMRGNDRLGLELTAVVDRSEYGIGWNMDLPGGRQAVANDVKLTVVVELVKEA